MLIIKNSYRHILNVFHSAGFTCGSCCGRNRDNELREIMERIGCSGENCEPTERKREFSGALQWEHEPAAGTVPRLLEWWGSSSGLWVFIVHSWPALRVTWAGENSPA